MLDTDFIRGRVHHYRHLADGTENRESAEALLSLAEAFEAEADLIQRSLFRRPRAFEGRER